ncbi:bombesin receptor-activated protein C6orf89 homolog isoform X1 [Brienomyrus brachyistius]|uniref:bombesin receptor-activated protein C6orf89 homolog isoform X1 n=1 Tax=Brienomyrus brachyistius TaxID=42636 RepID=UPI0020B23875|nr:bombesin receptor-activated protein C6orf89 homolog isoform X1 [Brienomyrus brachyistius]
MGMTLSEPCIYDKLSESIDILRQSGYRYGMSEKEIERFIKQVLETNEPRREPPQFPILLATVKFVVAVGFLLVVVLAFTYPQSHPQLGWAIAGTHNWSSPLSHVRLLSLPIAKKYNLQGFHQWWSIGHPRAESVNCSGCAAVSTILDVVRSLSGPTTLRRGVQPILFKGGEALWLQYHQLELLYSAHPEDFSILPGDPIMSPSQGFPPEPANFTLLLRSVPGSGQDVLHWLFPGVELCPLLDLTGTILHGCLVSHTTETQSRALQLHGWLLVGKGFPTARLLPVPQCHMYCSSFSLWLGPGDLVYADPRYWQVELFPGKGQNIICDGSAP